MGRKGTIYGVILAILIGFAGIAWAGFQSNVITATEGVRSDNYASETGTDTVTITELNSAVDLKHTQNTDTDFAQIRAEMATDTELAAETAQLRAEAATDTELTEGLADKVDSDSATYVAMVARVSDLEATDTPTFAGVLLSNQTASTIASFDASKQVTSLPVATYPSLTELTYMKAVTSAVQTQLNARATGTIGPGTAGQLTQFNSATGLSDSNVTDTILRTRTIRLAILDPNTLVDTDICIIGNLDNAITVTKIYVTCDANPDTELDGNIKWADNFIGLTTGDTVINDIDTTDGTRTDTTITSANVAAGKCIYLNFDTVPTADIKQIFVSLTYQFQ